MKINVWIAVMFGFMLLVILSMMGCQMFENIGEVIGGGSITAEEQAQAIGEANTADNAITGALVLLSGLGIPVVGWLGQLWGKAKPTRNMVKLVKAVENIRNRYATDNSKIKEDIDSTLSTMTDDEFKAFVSFLKTKYNV